MGKSHVSGGGERCNSSTFIDIVVLGPQVGVSYQLMLDGEDFDLPKTALSSQALVWKVNRLGTYTIKGSYGSCSTLLYGTAVVTDENEGNVGITPSTNHRGCIEKGFSLKAYGGRDYTWTYNGDYYSNSATIEPTESGTYRVTGEVSCGPPQSSSITLDFTKPVASITPSEGNKVCSTCTNMLTASTGQAYTYQWKKDGQSITQAYSSSYEASEAGNYTVEVTKGFCTKTSQPFSLEINAPPTADAGPDRIITLPVEAVTLTGSASDPDGDLLTYAWSQVSGPELTLSGRKTASPTLIGLRPGTFTFRLTVSDAWDTYYDEITVTVPNNYNYIETTTVLVRGKTTAASLVNLPVEKKNVSTTYFDGLGRPMQQVDWQASPMEQDVVWPIVYDQYGRETKKYLPFAHSAKNGWYKPNDGIIDTETDLYIGEAADFYALGTDNKVASDLRPFTETVFEPSPLNRPSSVYGPGQDWYNKGKYIEHEYLINEDGIATGQEKVIAWTINSSDLPVRYKDASFNNNSGYYPTASLAIKSTKDEEGMALREYTNKQGQVILKKVQLVKHAPLDLNNREYWVQTYYVYDELGNLRFLLTPELVHKLVQNASANPSPTDLKNFAFQYKYDERQRVTEKHVPGGGNTFMVYDKWDRLVLTQNEEQKLDNKWHYTKYDVFNRPIITGIYTDSRTNAAIQIALESATVRYESLNPQPGASSVYTNLSFPKTDTEALTAIYYDNYDFLKTVNWDVEDDNYAYVNDGLGNETYNNYVNGKVTGGKIKVLTTNTWLSSVTYYDDYYNPIQTINENYQDGTDRTSSQYDFSGKLLKTIHTHSGIENHKIVKDFKYDHAGRLLKIYHKVDQEPTVLLVKNEYNELGELVDKHLHATNSAETEFLQSVDYRYNIRGWLTRINNSDLSPEAGDTNDDLFGMGLFYNFGFDKPQYNGNISGARWKNVVDDQERAYGYTYDPLNRFTGADYVAGGTGNWTQEADRFEVGNISYDHNGNLKSLDRNGLFSHSPDGMPEYSIIDQLSYEYSGNRLMAVNDAKTTPEAGTKDFKDNGSKGSKENPEYGYDTNGNMTKDGNKGITVSYNYLNLPERVDFGEGKYIEYLYDANGAKLQQTVHDGENPVKQTDYDFGMAYENGELQFIQHEEGRVLPKDGGGWEYQYYLKDQLGSVRLTFTASPETDTDKATTETADEDNDRAEFLYYDQVTKINSDIFDHTNNGETHYSLRLNGMEDERIGLAKSLAVLPGDIINAKVHAKYIDHGESDGWSNALKALIVSIADGTAPAGTVIDGLPLPSGESYPFPDILNKSGDAPENPKAYLNFLVFDKHRKLIEEKSGYLPVTALAREDGTGVDHEELNTDTYGDIVIEEEGYVYIYLSNDNPEPVEVYFDDFEVTHVQSSLVQGDNYYPFGMEIADLGYRRENSTINNYRFQGDFNEKSDLTGWNSFLLRNYDSQIGRWTTVDPSAENYLDYSTYHFAGLNPINNIEINGADWYFNNGAGYQWFDNNAIGFSGLDGLSWSWAGGIDFDFGGALMDEAFVGGTYTGPTWEDSPVLRTMAENDAYFNRPIATGAVESIPLGADTFQDLGSFAGNTMAGNWTEAGFSLGVLALPGISSNLFKKGKTLLNSVDNYVVIGKYPDYIDFASKYKNASVLDLPNNWKHLPRQEAAKFLWKQNSSKLRGALREGYIPFDLGYGGVFYQAEKLILKNKGLSIQGDIWLK